MVATILDLFPEHVSPEPNSGCWLWAGGTNGAAGYGTIKGKYTHRLSYQMTKGEIPAGLELDHLCRVRCCCNPDHLEAVTRRTNLMRSPVFGSGRGKHEAAKTHCPRSHPYDEKNTGRHDGKRYCRECARLKMQRRRELGLWPKKAQPTG